MVISIVRGRSTFGAAKFVSSTTRFMTFSKIGRVETMGRTKGKLSKGQPKGARSASGRKRDRAVANIGPCLGVARRRAEFGLPANDVGEASPDSAKRGKQETHTCDAIGRAYISGLLGSGQEAEDLLNAGRNIARRYWSTLGATLTPDSLARFQPQDAAGEPMTQDERDQRDNIREASLLAALNVLDACGTGRHVRRAFDQLVIDPNPDEGPAWLDSIITAHRSKAQASARDYATLALALDGLRAIT
ncbi:hypothetical protein IFT85_02095 [Sphingomonas sp. CFBP 8764]|nr:hypothetical protein [Sphingomonas sp. CFBP 8764]